MNHSKEYAKDGVHVNIHHSVPDGLRGERIYNMTKSRYVDGTFICDQKRTYPIIEEHEQLVKHLYIKRN